MLVILSEINCLDNLRRLGVEPDEFYTDMRQFDNNSVTFREATIVVIFAGNCAFNKKRTIELVKNLMKRASATNDFGIKAVYVVSDTVIPSLSSYYKYTGNLNTVDIMNSWNVVKAGVDIWLKLSKRSVSDKCKTYFSDYDKGICDEARAAYEKRHKSEDDYVKLIKVPSVKEILQLS